MASIRLTRACSKAQRSIVKRCFPGASQQVKEAALVAVQQLPAREVASLDSEGTDAAGLIELAVFVEEDRQLCKLLVAHNKELAGAELVCAAECGKEERVRQLLSEGVSANAQDEHGRTPLTAVAVSEVLHDNVDLQLRVARLLLDAGASVAHRTLGATPLWESTARGRFALAHLLLDAGASVRATLFEMTLLHALVAGACQSLSCSPASTGEWEAAGLARRLVAAGLPVDELPPGSSRDTPLVLAATKGVMEGLQSGELLALVETLVDLGADPNPQSDSGLDVLVQLGTVLMAYDHSAPLHAANFRRLVQRLVAAGAPVNAQFQGVSVLGFMCQACTNPGLGPPEPLLRVLVEAGADLQEQLPDPLWYLALVESPGPNTPFVLRALAALGYPMDVEVNRTTALNHLLKDIYATCGNWPDQQPPTPLQLSCLEALLETGCPLVVRPQPDDVPDDHSSRRFDPASWLMVGIKTGSLAVVQALLRVYPAAATERSKKLFIGATALEEATKELWEDLACEPVEELEQPLEGKVGEHVLWYCTLASALLAAGSPPIADQYLDLSYLPGAAQVLCVCRFLHIVAHGSSWSPESHHFHPSSFCAAARQLLLINDCCGFGGDEHSSGQASGAQASWVGVRTRAGSRRSRKPVRALGVQLPQGVLHHILGLASQLSDWVPLLAAEQ